MTTSPSRCLARILAAALLVVAARPISAQAASGALPPAKDILARYLKSIGVSDAALPHTSMRTKGQFQMPAMGVTGDMTAVAAKPNKTTITVTISGLGEIKSGFDGDVAWAVDPMQGPRLIEGPELQQMKQEGAFLGSLRQSWSYQSAQTLERGEYGGEPCYKVKLVWKGGNETTDCYSVASGFLVATVATRHTSMGPMEMTTLLADYKDFGGIKMPSKMTQSAMGQQQVITISSVEFDTVEPTAFELPAEIKALKEKQAKPQGR